MSRYYEVEEYRLEEREHKNGLSRELVDNEEWSRGTPPAGFSIRRGASTGYPRESQSYHREATIRDVPRESERYQTNGNTREARGSNGYYRESNGREVNGRELNGNVKDYERVIRDDGSQGKHKENYHYQKDDFKRDPVYIDKELPRQEQYVNRESRRDHSDSRRSYGNFNQVPLQKEEKLYREKEWEQFEDCSTPLFTSRRPYSEVRGGGHRETVSRNDDVPRRRSASLRRPKITEEYREYKEIRRSTDNLHQATGRDTREAPYFSIQGRRPSSRHDLSASIDHSQSRPGSPGQVAGVGDIVNTEHGFTIQLDVNLFRPEEIKVVLTGDLLCVSGERMETTAPHGVPQQQTLRRSFSRKYCIPSDIKLDSIQSHLTDTGVLIINGARRGWKETHIMAHPPPYNEYQSSRLATPVADYRHSGRNSVISHV